MPLIITRGAASTLGLWSSGRNLTTATFTSNGTWVAPASVGMVSVLSGYGSPGVSDYIGAVSYGANVSDSPISQPNGPYLDYSTVYASYLNSVNTVTAGGSQNLYYYSYSVDSSNRWSVIQAAFSGNDPTYIIPGQTGVNLWLSAGYPTSGNVLYTDPDYGFNQTCQAYIKGNSGTSASALGQTFPGGTYTGTYPSGTGNAASTTTYTNISVTPGASYSIVVPTGGQIQIGYYI